LLALILLSNNSRSSFIPFFVPYSVLPNSDKNDAWMSEASIAAFVKTIDSLSKPVYVYCHVGFSATMFAEIYLARTGWLMNKAVFPLGRSLGWDYAADDASLAFLSKAVGLKPPPPPTTVTLERALRKQEASYVGSASQVLL
jgi:hypothetical protein